MTKFNEKEGKFDFYKYHGLGNDFIIFDLADAGSLEQKLTSDKIEMICNRNFGIGSDGILFLQKSDQKTAEKIPSFKLTIYNSDGSTAEMCGNGVRCIAHYLKDKGYIKNSVKLLTEAGVITPQIIDYSPHENISKIKVNMGSPEFSPFNIPVKLNYFDNSSSLKKKDNLLNIEYDFFTVAPTEDSKVNIVSMGNPHAIFFVEEKLSEIPLEDWGPKIETHKIFPENINVEFANIKDKKNIKVRVWERGSGITLACGTGASAVAAAAISLDLTCDIVDVELPGGTLSVDWSEEELFIIGPSQKVFAGKVKI